MQVAAGTLLFTAIEVASGRAAAVVEPRQSYDKRKQIKEAVEAGEDAHFGEELL